MRSFFAKRVQKISVNTGSSCPNRQNGLGACAWCDGTSFLPAYCSSNKDIVQQIEEGLKFFEHKSAEQDYLVYFQGYTSTWGDQQTLLVDCQQALTVPGVRGILISTRPDTLSDSLLDALALLSQRTFLALEIGIESCLNKTLLSMNRGHNFAAVEQAFDRAHSRGLRLGAHLILGLPGESYQEQVDHAQKISFLKPHSIKLHHLQVLAGSALAKRFATSPEQFQFASLLEYRQLVIDFLERLAPEILVERFLNESPPQRILAPHWGGVKNYAFADDLRKYMIANKNYQGRLWSQGKVLSQSRQIDESRELDERTLF